MFSIFATFHRAAFPSADIFFRLRPCRCIFLPFTSNNLLSNLQKVGTKCPIGRFGIAASRLLEAFQPPYDHAVHRCEILSQRVEQIRSHALHTSPSIGASCSRASCLLHTIHGVILVGVSIMVPACPHLRGPLTTGTTPKACTQYPPTSHLALYKRTLGPILLPLPISRAMLKPANFPNRAIAVQDLFDILGTCKAGRSILCPCRTTIYFTSKHLLPSLSFKNVVTQCTEAELLKDMVVLEA